MWNCHSWPLDVSNNLSGYFISNSVLDTSCVCMGGYICFLYMFMHCKRFSKYTDLVNQYARHLSSWDQGGWVHLPFPIMNNIEQRRGHSAVWQFWLGGSIISFTQVKLTFPYICLWYLYVYICTGISLYILISWLFRMGSHWQHWTAKSSLSALAVSNGGSIISFTWVKLTFPYICLWYLYVYICTGISLYILISWPFRMGSHWWHWTAKSSPSALAVLNGGGLSSVLPGVNLKIWTFF